MSTNERWRIAISVVQILFFGLPTMRNPWTLFTALGALVVVGNFINVGLVIRESRRRTAVADDPPGR